MSRKKVLYGLFAAAFWLALWQLAAVAVGQELLIPAPAAVFSALFELCLTAGFWATVGISLLRVVCGVLLGGVMGVLLAVPVYVSQAAAAVISPAVRAVRATPVVCFILLVLLWLPRAHVPVGITALMVMPVVWENVVLGLRSADGDLLELARAYRFSRFKRALLVYFPALFPYLTGSMAAGLGLGWKAGVAAEVLCASTSLLGIGTEIYKTKLYLETPALFAWTIAIIAASVVMEDLAGRLLNYVKGRLLHHD